MEFYGPHRELLARMHQRCVDRGWYGPEIEAPNERQLRGLEPDEMIFFGHLSEEQIRKSTPYLSQVIYHYDLWRGRDPATIVHICDDVRRHQFLYPPLTTVQIAQVEDMLGFSMPSMLRDVYTQLANGGFGFWCGFFGIVGGAGWGSIPGLGEGFAKNSKKLSDFVPKWAYW